MLVPITRSCDFSWGGSLHNFSPTPPGTTPPFPDPAVELPLPQSWPPGVQLGSVQKTSTVLASNWAIMQKGHDYGKLVPQLTIPPTNFWLAILSIDAKRKCMFSAFSVRMDKKPTGCMGIWPPLPMLACGQPVSSPLVLSPTNICTSVRVGMSGADIVGGALSIIFSMLSDGIKESLGLKKDSLEEALYDAVSGAAIELLSTFVQHAMDPRYPISAQFTVEGREKLWLGASTTVGVSFGSTDTTNNPSKVTFSTGANALVNVTSVSATADYTWDAGTNSSAEGLTVGAKGEFRALEYTVTGTTQAGPTGTSEATSTNLPYQQTTTTQSNSGPATTTTVPKDFWGTAL